MPSPGLHKEFVITPLYAYTEKVGFYLVRSGDRTMRFTSRSSRRSKGTICCEF